MARKLNSILAEIDAGKKPEVNQVELLAELAVVMNTLAEGKPEVKAGTFCSPDGELDFKYATVNDKLAIANKALRSALVVGRQVAQEVVGISGADYTEDEIDTMIDKETVAIIVKNGKLRNLTVESKSSLF